MISDQKIIMALLSSASIREAAEKAGCSEGVIYARKKKDGFRAQYAAAKRELLEQNSDRLLQHITMAVETMGSLASCAKSESVRLSAAETIIELYLKTNEQLDLLVRLEKLESMHGGLNENN